MAAQNVPVETWQTILRYSISVPVFFETDPIETCGFREFIKWYGNEEVYWRAERRRNVLRRVCKRWNLYLKTFDHRYVKLQDVHNGFVPASAIPRAIRLFFPFSSPLFDKDYPSFLSIVLGSITDNPEPWTLEILDGQDDEFRDKILKNANIPNIRSILKGDYLGLDELGGKCPNISFTAASFATSQQAHHEFQSLTTLIVYLDSSSHVPHSLPSLKHLKLLSRRDHRLEPHKLLSLLERVGHNLTTFYDEFRLGDDVFPEEAWSLIPKIQRIKTSFKWSSQSTVPLSLGLFYIPGKWFFRYDAHDPSRIPVEALSRAGVNITFDQEWSMALGSGTLLMDYMIYAMDYGAEVYDVRGVKLQDMFVELLKHRKKGGRRSLYEWDRGHFIF